MGRAAPVAEHLQTFLPRTWDECLPPEAAVRVRILPLSEVALRCSEVLINSSKRRVDHLVWVRNSRNGYIFRYGAHRTY